MKTSSCLLSVLLLASVAEAAEWHSLGKNNLLEAQ
jgi:hypothetical protein